MKATCDLAVGGGSSAGGSERNGQIAPPLEDGSADLYRNSGSSPPIDAYKSSGASPPQDRSIAAPIRPPLVVITNDRPAELGTRAFLRTKAFLESVGNRLSPLHEAALATLHTQYERQLLDPSGKRIAVGVAPGSGKSTSAAMFGAEMYLSKQKGGMLYAAERIAELAWIAELLDRAGVPRGPGGWGAYHSGGDYNEITPRIDRADIPKVKLLLVSHQGMTFKDFTLYSRYDNRLRLLAWDESCVASTGHSIDTGPLLTGVNALLVALSVYREARLPDDVVEWLKGMYDSLKNAIDHGVAGHEVLLPTLPAPSTGAHPC